MTKKREPPRNPSVHASSYGRCPKGHQRVQLHSGRDALGLFLDLWCKEPGCGTKARIRDEGRIGG